MPSSLDHALRMEALSDLLLRRHETKLWREVFLGSAMRVSFDAATLTLVCTDAPQHEWPGAELASLAARFGGWCEVLTTGTAVLCFSQPALALRAALLLQKVGSDHRVRAFVTAEPCTIAWIDTGRDLRQFVLPCGSQRAEMGLQGVGAGAVAISPEIYEELEPLLAKEARGALVATEFDDTEAAIQTSITLVPARSAALSTFAGLGLC